MGLQLIPLGLVVQDVVRQIDDHLADEVVGPVPHIVPQRHLSNGIISVDYAYRGALMWGQLTSSSRPLRSQRLRPE